MLPPASGRSGGCSKRPLSAGWKQFWKQFASTPGTPEEIPVSSPRTGLLSVTVCLARLRPKWRTHRFDAARPNAPPAGSPLACLDSVCTPPSYPGPVRPLMVGKLERDCLPGSGVGRSSLLFITQKHCARVLLVVRQTAAPKRGLQHSGIGTWARLRIRWRPTAVQTRAPLALIQHSLGAQADRRAPFSCATRGTRWPW